MTVVIRRALDRKMRGLLPQKPPKLPRTFVDRLDERYKEGALQRLVQKLHPTFENVDGLRPLCSNSRLGATFTLRAGTCMEDTDQEVDTAGRSSDRTEQQVHSAQPSAFIGQATGEHLCCASCINKTVLMRLSCACRAFCSLHP